MRQVMCGGDVLRSEPAEALRCAAECAVAQLVWTNGDDDLRVTCWEWRVVSVTDECADWEHRSRIPRSMCWTNSCEPVPVGVVGELYLGGECDWRVAIMGRAELTAERFIPHPYSRVGGERLYRTGDEGRYRADGNLEFQGRADQQVKLRGYRIELGEIEAVLSQHEAVQEAVVVVQTEAGEQKRLVAYVVSVKRSAANDE